MTPEEIQLLQSLGTLSLENLAIVICKSGFYGIYLVLSAMAVYSLWNRDLKTKPTIILLLAIAAVFVSITVDFISNIAVAATLLREILVNNSELPFVTRFNLGNDRVLSWLVVQVWVTGVNQGIVFWAGDAVVVWRVSLMFPHHKSLRYALVLFLFLGIVSAIGYSLLMTIRHPMLDPIDSKSAESIMLLFSVADFILVNAVATSLIAAQTYKHRQMMKAALDKSQSLPMKVMSMLIESGVIYCVIQIIAIALNYAAKSAGSVLGIIEQLWAELALFASAIYPVLVILIVNHQKSIMDTLDLTDMLSTNIRFAEPPHSSTTKDHSIIIDIRNDGNRESDGFQNQNRECSDSTDLEKGKRLFQVHS